MIVMSLVKPGFFVMTLLSCKSAHKRLIEGSQKNADSVCE